MTKRIFIIAGEASGDFLGGYLIHDLKALYPDLEFRGIGGIHMAKEGLFSLFPMQELSIMGIGEVLPHLFSVYKRFKQTKEAIKAFNPDILITIDSPGFTLPIAKFAKQYLKIPVIHYVAPSVWAWRTGRAKKIAKTVDHLLCLYPFEPAYFTKHGLKATFVGHPLTRLPFPEDENFRSNTDISKESTLICVLPGSRRFEIINLLDIFLEAAALLPRCHQAEVVIPTLPHLKPLIEAQLSEYYLPVKIVTNEGQKWQAFMQSSIALAASGTVSLELAYAGVPQIIGYKVNPFTYFLGKRLVKIPYISMVNILARQLVVPELLQMHCRAETLSIELEKILSQSQLQKSMRLAYAQVISALKPSSSNLAANVVASYF